jgi:hypothetical protein
MSKPRRAATVGVVESGNSAVLVTLAPGGELHKLAAAAALAAAS